MDYASEVWASKGTKSTLKCLQPPQRIAAQAITTAFSSVFLEVVEVEADIQLIQIRHFEQQRRFWINGHTLEKTHPIYKSTSRAKRSAKGFTSPLQTVAFTFRNLDLLTWNDHTVLHITMTIETSGRDTAIARGSRQESEILGHSCVVHR